SGVRADDAGQAGGQEQHGLVEQLDLMVARGRGLGELPNLAPIAVVDLAHRADAARQVNELGLGIDAAERDLLAEAGGELEPALEARLVRIHGRRACAQRLLVHDQFAQNGQFTPSWRIAAPPPRTTLSVERAPSNGSVQLTSLDEPVRARP